MRQPGLPKPKKCSQNPANEAIEEDLVERKFAASAPSELWLTDTTDGPRASAKSPAVSPHWSRNGLIVAKELGHHRCVTQPTPRDGDGTEPGVAQFVRNPQGILSICCESIPRCDRGHRLETNAIDILALCKARRERPGACANSVSSLGNRARWHSSRCD